MRLTDSTDLAMRVLIYAASTGGRLFTIDDIVTTFGQSRGTVMKVVNMLTRAEFLTGHRGRNGGLSLAKPAEDIRVSEIVLETEPDMGLVECLRPGNMCRITSSCLLINPLLRARTAFVNTLAEYTLADLVLQPRVFEALQD
ncbi:RrF2 family transcriptional regulator [Paracoccus fistulariae]|uniref:Rrf2 family transcriptional regulator n=1 Tax=Paracoccus fistulariae TaxID=658446 RepID=A0ABY7SHQ6_9RHOB|nr:Rrf2 family transcriptional regulator [Paracoccus fistulariae]MDB6182895.1 Rrf2 family transcriptional regulator [Paracoccus fistulariae]WCR06098.1 Rrf2 family transcriptional regulator [Paracoccus fistulariae]